MESISADEALSWYPLVNPTVELIRHNENRTYKVCSGREQYVLRIHQPAEGFSLDVFEVRGSKEPYIRSEMEILSQLSFLGTQTPVLNRVGNAVTIMDNGTPVTLLRWIQGETVENKVQTPQLLTQIGRMTAALHQALRNLSVKPIPRYDYGQRLLLYIQKQIRAAAWTGVLNSQQERLIFKALDEISARMEILDRQQEKQLIHSDLSKSNMIVNLSGKVIPIDFSLCGFGHLYMDLGGLFGHYTKTEERLSIIKGYYDESGLHANPVFIEPYYALQVILFIACQYERAKSWDWFGDAAERWCNEIFRPLGNKAMFLTESCQLL